MPFQYTSLAQLPLGYAHIYLSPHLDDAAISCGGAIARFAAEGQPVLVVNVCSGSPPPGGPFSPFAELQHARWGLPADQAVALRRAEDAAALEILGADCLQLDLLDAIYRMPTAYRDDATLFGPLAAADTLQAELRPLLHGLAARYPGAIFYAPLAVGFHVDHQAVHAAAADLTRAGVAVASYEDLPYACATGALARRLEALGGPELFVPAVTLIGAQLGRKLAALEAYASQLGTLFGGSAQMVEAITSYAQQVTGQQGGAGERIWMRS